MNKDDDNDGAQVAGPEAQGAYESPSKRGGSTDPDREAEKEFMVEEIDDAWDEHSPPFTARPMNDGGRPATKDRERTAIPRAAYPVPMAAPHHYDGRQQNHRPREHIDPYMVRRMKQATLEKKRADPPIAFPIAMMIALAILGSLFIQGVVSTSNAKEEEEVENMRIEEVFFILTHVDDDSITVDITIYLTNTGNKDTGEVNITAFAKRTKTNIGSGQGSAIISKIETGKTDNAKISMEFDKNETFKIEIMVFDDRYLGPQGYGEITTGDVDQSAEDFVNEGSGGSPGNAEDDDDKDEAMMGADSSASFVLCFFVFIPVLLIILFMAAAKQGWL